MPRASTWLVFMALQVWRGGGQRKTVSIHNPTSEPPSPTLPHPIPDRMWPAWVWPVPMRTQPASDPRRLRGHQGGLHPPVAPPLSRQGSTHLPSTASTSRHAISCSSRARSMRSRRSCRRFRLIMKTCGPQPLLDPPGWPPAPTPREGPAYLVKAHLVWRLGGH